MKRTVTRTSRRLGLICIGALIALTLTACTNAGTDATDVTAVEVVDTATNGNPAQPLGTPTDSEQMTGFTLLQPENHNFHVMSVDPVSGALTHKRSFDPPTGVTLSSLFNNKYTKIAAKDHDIRDGSSMSRHVGYLTADGVFHDMSALAPAVGDFETATDTAVGFDDNDAFYFTRESGENTIYKVAADSTIAESVPYTEGEWNYGNPIINGDGTLNGLATSGKPWCADGAEDISIDQELCLDISLDKFLYTYDMIVGKAPPKPSWPEPDNSKTPGKQQLLPEGNKRNIDSAVFNADGTQVAFLANEGPIGGRLGGLKQLYIVSLDDLSITNVETAPSLDTALSGAISLIDWPN